MDYAEARGAFFTPRDPAAHDDTGPGSEPGSESGTLWSTPARRLRDAIEPLATVCFWSEPAYDAHAARGLDFLQGYVWGRASVLGEPEATVAAAAFGVFEPSLVADLYASGRSTCSLQEVRSARLEGVTSALVAALGEPGPEVAETVAELREAIGAAPLLGRPFFAGLSGQAWPEHPWAALWHACTLLRELRGDGHLAALVAAGIDGVEANLLTEAWVGWEPLAYAGSRAWSPEAMAAASASLQERGLVEDGVLTSDGRALREQLEAATDASVAAVVSALGDRLETLTARLDGWSGSVVERGWFPPDPFKRASG